MKTLFTAIAMFAIAALISFPASAQTYSNTLYGQEGDLAKDGYLPIDASGQGPAKDDSDNYTNWKYQYGSGSWSGVYSWDGDAWCTEAETGDEKLDIECDIELYVATTTTNNKIYFHLGNPFSAGPGAKTAHVDGTFVGNHGCWIGISFAETDKVEADFEKVGDNYTGRILGGMVGTVDLAGNDISTEAFDLVITMRTDGGSFDPPDHYGDGAHSTITDSLWWLVNNKLPGSYNLTWKIVLEPPVHQVDGNYNLDPEVVIAPTL